MEKQELNEKYKILLLEDNPADARLVREFLKEEKDIVFEVTHVDFLSKAEECLAKEHFDIILLDLAVPDGKGPELIARVLARAPQVPIVVLTGTYEDEVLARELLRKGAQDYLFKGKIDGVGLTRAIHYAIERKRFADALTATKKELEEKVNQLETLNKIMMGREERILELKGELEKVRGKQQVEKG